MGVPASLAVSWQASPAVAIRPEFTFDLFDAESTSTSRLGTSQFSSDTRQIGVGVSALFQVYREDTTDPMVESRIGRTGIRTSAGVLLFLF